MSFVRTLIDARDVSSAITALSSTATGGSLVLVTVMRAVIGAPDAPPLSVAVTVMVAMPYASADGVKVSRPVASIAGGVLNSVGASSTTAKVTVWPASSTGPAEMAVAHAVRTAGPESSMTMTSAPLLKVGASLTGVTVMRAVTGGLVAPALSVRATAMVAEPWAFGAGVKVRRPVEPIDGATANRPGLSLMTAKVDVWAASSAGPGEMAVAHAVRTAAPESSVTVTFAPMAKVGTSLTGVTITVTPARSHQASRSQISYWKPMVPLRSAAGAKRIRASSTTATPPEGGTVILSDAGSMPLDGARSFAVTSTRTDPSSATVATSGNAVIRTGAAPTTTVRTALDRAPDGSAMVYVSRPSPSKPSVGVNDTRSPSWDAVPPTTSPIETILSGSPSGSVSLSTTATVVRVK